jgi:hypothetical protein
MKNATAISHGNRRALEAAGDGCDEGASFGVGKVLRLDLNCSIL